MGGKVGKATLLSALMFVDAEKQFFSLVSDDKGGEYANNHLKKELEEAGLKLETFRIKGDRNNPPYVIAPRDFGFFAEGSFFTGEHMAPDFAPCRNKVDPGNEREEQVFESHLEKFDKRLRKGVKSLSRPGNDDAVVVHDTKGKIMDDEQQKIAVRKIAEKYSAKVIEVQGYMSGGDVIMDHEKRLIFIGGNKGCEAKTQDVVDQVSKHTDYQVVKLSKTSDAMIGYHLDTFMQVIPSIGEKPPVLLLHNGKGDQNTLTDESERLLVAKYGEENIIRLNRRQAHCANLIEDEGKVVVGGLYKKETEQVAQILRERGYEVTISNNPAINPESGLHCMTGEVQQDKTHVDKLEERRKRDEGREREL